MSSLKGRLNALERIAEDALPLLPGVVLFRDGELTEAQQQTIAEAEANGQEIIIFNIVDASIAEE
ncbi:hypothetical protein ABXJ76_15575 [Methylobacter sp. G7]|uniref:hypothetical protein n=1 Tax=Methylobacter sp. G7 TaxID=3230117 RepID=UPI003D808296